MLDVQFGDCDVVSWSQQGLVILLVETPEEDREGVRLVQGVVVVEDRAVSVAWEPGRNNTSCLAVDQRLRA